MLTIPGVELDAKRSILTLAGVEFPASVVIAQFGWLKCDAVCVGCAPHGGCPFGGAAFLKDPTWERGWEVFVPMENGAIVGVALEGDLLDASVAPHLDLHTYAPRMVPNRFTDSDDKRSLEIMHIDNRQFTVHRWRRRAEFEWQHAEPEWAAEFIQRVSRYPVEANIEGQPVQLVPLSQVYGKVVHNES